MQISTLQADSHQYARARGFWEPDADDEARARREAVAIALIASEAFEALDAHRKTPAGELHSEAMEDEIADCVIRCCDFAGALGFSLERAIYRVQEKSRDRPRLHGKRY